ncbi:MAG: hypothetical protein IT463_06135 [Planctomycetes bacterium]|nr:hypothetical protein [Planctomycetota bacterium]
MLDTSNRVRIAELSALTLLEPRPEARQVLRLERGELWGRFVSSSHAWAVEFPLGDSTMLAHGATSAEFDLVLAPGADRVPDNLTDEAARALAAVFEFREGKAVALRRVAAVAGVRFRVTGAPEGEFAAIEAGDEVLDAGFGAPANADDLERVAGLALRGTLLLRRGGNQLALEAVAGQGPAAVLRVYRGSVMLKAGQGSEQLNRGQWAAFYPALPMLVGLRGPEDYRLLRMDTAERFKDQFHWLNTESFPLRAENNLLAVERRLGALADALEAQRSGEVARDARTEIDAFERLLTDTLAAAKARLAEGKGNPRAEGELGLSDEELVRGEAELLGAVAHWRKTSATGAYSTLGAAAKTLHARITKDREDMAARDADLGRAAALKQRIADLDAALAVQDDAIAKLKQGELYDGDGSKRTALDADIRKQLDAARAGRDATQRLELIRLKLNELDAQADTERRKLAPLREALSTAEKALADVDAALAANAHTAEKLAAAEQAVTAGEAALTRANALVKEQEAALSEADSALQAATTAATEAEKPVAEAVLRREQAAEDLATAVALRAEAAQARDNAAQAVKDAEAALAAMSQNDPGRAKAEADLEKARTALTAADQTLKSARDKADSAKGAHESAEKLQRDLEAALEAARKARTGAAETRASAATRLEQGRKDAAAAQAALETGRQALKAQQDAKVAREALDKQRSEAATRVARARGDLKTVQDAVAAIDAEAQPRRDKMAEENKLAEAGEAASAEAKKLAARRDQYQAVLDEITLREKERKTSQDERDRVAGSQLITGHDTLVAEFRQLSARVDLLEYLRARAMAEDQAYSHAQQAARDRYREASAAADTEAAAFLLERLRPYRDFTLADIAADAETIRRKLALALWRLYYDTGTDSAPDAAGQACYYVAVRSGAGEDALRALDDRWALALSQVLDRARYEKAGKLQAADLVAAPRE